MSLFSCPNASRSLWSVLARGISSKAARGAPSPFTPSRWLSTCSTVSQPAFRPSLTCRHAVLPPSDLPGSRRTFFSDKTIKNYEDLPRDYRDQVGLPFRSLDLTDSEVTQVFGRGINSKRANHLLRILHGRRVAGTLEDPAFAIHTAQFTKDQKAKALEYLRKSIPVNEVMNAGLRAEDELALLEAEVEEKGKNAAKHPEEEKAPHPRLYKPDPVYGHSRFDEIRAHNVAKRKAQEAAEEEERRQAEARGEVASGPLAVREDGTRQIANPRIAEYAKAAQSDLEEPPEMKTWERILPSATVVALVIGFLGAVTMVYEEPSPRYRLLREISTAQATVGAVIAINTLVFLAWKAPPLWRILNKYMIFVVATPKPITMFTAPFSHQKFSHFILNMIPLWFIGNAVHEEVGRANFLTLYLACGALGFVGSLTAYTLRGLLALSSLGASGATLGLCSAYFWEHRDDGFRFFGLPEDGAHGIIFLALLFVPQLAGLGKTVTMKVDITSHLVGMLTGILGIEYINRTRKNKEKRVIDVFSHDDAPAKGGYSN